MERTKVTPVLNPFRTHPYRFRRLVPPDLNLVESPLQETPSTSSPKPRRPLLPRSGRPSSKDPVDLRYKYSQVPQRHTRKVYPRTRRSVVPLKFRRTNIPSNPVLRLQHRGESGPEVSVSRSKGHDILGGSVSPTVSKLNPFYLVGVGSWPPPHFLNSGQNFDDDVVGRLSQKEILRN